MTVMAWTWTRFFHSHITPKIQSLVPLGVPGWQLYSGCPRAGDAAREMSAALLSMMADIGRRFTSGMEALDRIQSRYASVGAGDTEPRAEMRHALRTLFRYLEEQL